MTEFTCDHLFKITFAPSKFEALVTKACRSVFQIEPTAHDPAVVPQVRLYTVHFETPEDRDRVRIAMRFLEKEQAALEATRAPAAPQVQQKLARA